MAWVIKAEFGMIQKLIKPLIFCKTVTEIIVRKPVIIHIGGNRLTYKILAATEFGHVPIFNDV